MRWAVLHDNDFKCICLEIKTIVKKLMRGIFNKLKDNHISGRGGVGVHAEESYGPVWL